MFLVSEIVFELWLLYTSTSVWVAQPKRWSESSFSAEKTQKVTNLVQNLAKKLFLSLHQNAGRVYFDRFDTKSNDSQLFLDKYFF